MTGIISVALFHSSTDRFPSSSMHFAIHTFFLHYLHFCTSSILFSVVSFRFTALGSFARPTGIHHVLLSFALSMSMSDYDAERRHLLPPDSQRVRECEGSKKCEMHQTLFLFTNNTESPVLSRSSIFLESLFSHTSSEL